MFGFGSKFLVESYENAVLYHRGVFDRVLTSGQYRFGANYSYTLLDMREQQLTTSIQEVPSADGLMVRVSVSITWKINSPTLYLDTATDPCGQVYLAAQIALREVAAGLTAEELARRNLEQSSEQLLPPVIQAANRVGIEVLGLVIKDIILPAELRATAIELATAKRRGQIALETARAETAALRSLANAGKILRDYPELAQQRLVHGVPSGSQIVLTVGEAYATHSETNAAHEKND